ncbi:helix-hairpin-helix domain-containing protein [Streptomyces sp. NPDC059740]|uniref:helix-hairpin-helix domain-containing protein n=1 Tax=Streptomyces sp. NPDC059740 TaxID=3346926 RepID=UPI00365BC964
MAPPEAGAADSTGPGKPPAALPGAGGERARRALDRLAPTWTRLPLWVQARCGLSRRALAALLTVFAVGLGLAVVHFGAAAPKEVPPATLVTPAAVSQRSTAPPTTGTGRAAQPRGTLVVDVAGRVRDPGVRHLPAGARVADALRAAGGTLKGANTDNLNRARLLVDGEQILVAGPGTAAGPAAPSVTEGTVGKGPGPALAGAPPASAGGAAGAAVVHLNTATPQELETLPGVGPVLAQHIVEYRTQHGGFTSVSQLRDVNGIGDRRFSDLRPRVQP